MIIADFPYRNLLLAYETENISDCKEFFVAILLLDTR